MNIWVLRPKIDEETTAEDFINNELIAIGWDKLPDLKSKTKAEISDMFHEKYEESGQKASLNIGIIDRFVNEFSIGDIVFIPDDEKVHVAEITEDYKYDLTNNISPHIRKVKWLRKNVFKSSLPDKLQQGLKSRMSLYSLNKYYDFIAYWFNNNAESLEDKFLNYSDKLKSFIGLEAIKHVGTWSQGHYDVVFLSLKEFMTEDYKEIVEDIISKSRGIFVELNNIDLFDEFVQLLTSDELPRNILKKKIELSNEYKNRLLDILDVNKLKKMSEDETDDESYEIYLINKEINENYSNLDVKDLIYSMVKEEIDNNLSKEEENKLNNSLDYFVDPDPEVIEFFKKRDLDIDKYKKFESKLQTILSVLSSFDMD